MSKSEGTLSDNWALGQERRYVTVLRCCYMDPMVSGRTLHDDERTRRFLGGKRPIRGLSGRHIAETSDFCRIQVRDQVVTWRQIRRTRARRNMERNDWRSSIRGKTILMIKCRCSWLSLANRGLEITHFILFWYFVVIVWDWYIGIYRNITCFQNVVEGVSRLIQAIRRSTSYAHR